MCPEQNWVLTPMPTLDVRLLQDEQKDVSFQYQFNFPSAFNSVKEAEVLFLPHSHSMLTLDLNFLSGRVKFN